MQVCGFKVPSPLLKLPSSHIVNGIAIDAMHCVFLGVVKQLVGLWFNSKHSGPKESPPYQSLHLMSHFHSRGKGKKLNISITSTETIFNFNFKLSDADTCRHLTGPKGDLLASRIKIRLSVIFPQFEV